MNATDTAKNREYCRKYREAHREQYNARSRAYAAAHPEQRRAWNAANREHRNAYQRAHPEHGLFNQARIRAKRYGVPCTLTLADVRELPAPMVCTATGLPLAHSKGQPSALSPSIDRIENSRGYVPGNVRLVCQRFNVLRKDDHVSHDYRHALRVLAETDHTGDRWGA